MSAWCRAVTSSFARSSSTRRPISSRIRTSGYFFAIPYEQDYTLIGTTDQDYEGKLATCKFHRRRSTICAQGASEYFSEPVTRDDIVWTYSGVRPLVRRRRLQGSGSHARLCAAYGWQQADDPKVINVFGGKITTYRRLAEAMLEKIADAIGTKGAPWTRDSVLPGGEFGVSGLADLMTKRQPSNIRFWGLSERALVRSYGRKLFEILDEVPIPQRILGEDFGHGLFEAEVRLPDPVMSGRRPRMTLCGAAASSEFALRTAQMARLQAFMDKQQTPAKPCSGVGIVRCWN